jgi:hypothetical protein
VRLKPALLGALLVFAPAADAQGMMHDPTRTPAGGGVMDPGLGDRPGMNTMATVTYDPVTHERVTYSLDRATGGFIDGVNIQTHKSWRADVRFDGSMVGKDADGDRWKFDRRANLYTNLTTGKTCEKTSLRRVCAP